VQFYDHNIIAVDLEAGSAAATPAATIQTAPGGASVNQGLSLCGSGRHLYASEWLPAPALRQAGGFEHCSSDLRRSVSHARSIGC